MEHARIRNQLPPFHTVSLLTHIYLACVPLTFSMHGTLSCFAKPAKKLIDGGRALAEPRFVQRDLVYCG
jgi:hypothetical protein